MKKQHIYLALCAVVLAAAVALVLMFAFQPEKEAGRILDAAGVKGGLVVHLGCGDGRLTAALRAGDRYLVQGLERDAEKVGKAREHVRSKNLYGPVSVDLLTGERLPYIDNLVNLVISEDPGRVSREEILRVLCPQGVAYIKEGGAWSKTVKSPSGNTDEWTHYLHDPGGNPVSHDKDVGPPRGLQWIGSQPWSRHHDHMSSFSALVTSGGRIFYIIDQGPTFSIEAAPKWRLVAEDAYNGTILWTRPINEWHTHLWPLKSGPAQLPRRLVAEGERVYVTLGIDEPVSMLDAASGVTLREYPQTRSTEEILLSDGVLYLLANENRKKIAYENVRDIRRWSNEEYWGGQEAQVKAIQAETGELLWTHRSRVLPITLALDQRRVYFHDGESVVSLNRNDGREAWRSEAIERSPLMKSYFAPTLIAMGDVVLFAGGERAGQQTGWDTSADKMTALASQTGEILWTSDHPASGYRSPEDVFVVNNVVWTGDTTSGRGTGEFTGRDLLTGAIQRRFAPDVDTYWFHHRCYRGKATDLFLLTSRSGIEFINPQSGSWQPNHWVRGACLYGIMPSNGLIYAPPSPCACYLESKQNGFNALTAKTALSSVPRELSEAERLEPGPAYGQISDDAEAAGQEAEWPTYRHDPGRSGFTEAPVSSELEPAWKTPLGGKLTSVTVAGGRLFVVSMDDHTVHALDADSGRPLWQYTAGGRIDSPPTAHQGLVLFGCADGWVYGLRSSDGELAWRFLAAPADRRLVAYNQVESVWPTHGSVLVQDNVLYVVAGRSRFLDGGLRLWRLDPRKGQALSQTRLDDKDPAGKQVQDYVSWLNMPAALPDVMSSDGRLVYMRSQPFDPDGTCLPLEQMPRTDDADRGAVIPVQRPELAHLFTPTGFLDDSWWHRSYWMYGSTFVSGWSGYFLAGKTAPAGRILVFDGDHVYGFGRKPEFYRWTTPMEDELFASDKAPQIIKSTDAAGREDQRIAHLWSKTIPLLVRAMVLSGKTLFVAGPPDLLDEVEAANRIGDPQVQAQIAAQSDAFAGKAGARLWALSADGGDRLAEYELAAAPVFDGMAAARGRLYFSTVDGAVECFAERRR